MPGGFDTFEVDAVLRAFGAGEGGLDGGEVEFDDGGVDDLGFVGGIAPEALGFVVLLDGSDEFFIASGQAEVGQSRVIDGEEADGRAVFGCHVGDGGAVGDGHVGQARAEELDELVDDAMLSEDLRDDEDEVGRGAAFFE